MLDSVQHEVRAEAKKVEVDSVHRRFALRPRSCQSTPREREKGPPEKEKTPGEGDEVERLRGRSK